MERLHGGNGGVWKLESIEQLRFNHNQKLSDIFQERLQEVNSDEVKSLIKELEQVTSWIYKNISKSVTSHDEYMKYDNRRVELRQSIMAKLKELGFSECYLDKNSIREEYKQEFEEKKQELEEAELIEKLFGVHYRDKRNFKTDHYKNADEVRQAVLDIKSRDIGNMLITGTTGTGKTLLTTVITRSLFRKGITPKVVKSYDLFTELKDYEFNKHDKNFDYSRIIHTAYQSKVLIIDDLGTEVQDRFTDSLVYTVLDKRMNNGLITIITTNLTGKQVNDRYSERVLSRIMHNGKYLILISKDGRNDTKRT